MTVQSITPYLFFSGEAEAATEFYQRAMGARVDALMRWGDQPQACPSGKENQVMHAALHIDDAVLFLSDSPTDSPENNGANGPALAVQVNDADEMQRKFDALAVEGTVVDTIKDAFWGDKFGVVRDRFGITWMFTCPSASQEGK